MRSLSSCCILGLVLALGLTAALYAVPIELSHQGRLLDSEGQPLTGSFQVTYRLFDSPTGGSLLWEEAQPVSAEDGLFTATLGKSTPLDLTSFGIRPDSLYLEIQVDGDSPLSPRTQLTAAPMAATAASVRGDIKTDSGSLLVDYVDADDDDDGISMVDRPDSTSMTLFKTSTGDTRSWDYRVYGPGDAHFGSITMRSQTAGVTDTMYNLDLRADARVEKTTFKQEFGPTNGSRNRVDGSHSSSTNYSANQGDTSAASVDATESRSILKSYFETGGQVTSEASMSTTVDAADANLSKADAKRALDAFVNNVSAGLRFIDSSQTAVGGSTVSSDFGIGPLSPGTPDESFGSYLRLLSLSSDLVDTTTVYSLEADAAGASMSLSDSLGTPTLRLSGNDGLRCSSPAYPGEEIAVGTFDAAGSGGPKLLLSGLSGSLVAEDIDRDGTPDLMVSGYTSVGTEEHLATLTVGGDICASGPIGQCSDARLKKDVAPIEDALEKVCAMRGVTYDWRVGDYPALHLSNDRQIGVIAQEVMKVGPHVVEKSENGFYAVDYAKLTPLLIEAVKTQQQMIKDQGSEIESLKQSVAALQATVTQLAAAAHGGHGDKYADASTH